MKKKKIIVGAIVSVWLIVLVAVAGVVIKSLFFQVKEEIAEASITEADIEAKVFKQHEMMGAELLKAEMEPFFQEYCIGCHGPKKQKGDLRFDTISYEIDNIDTAQHWQDILDQLNMGEMPPFDEEQPTKREMKGALVSLTGSVMNARKRLTDHGGKIEMRRMNKREYAATIKDLFGLNVDPHEIPDDVETPNFDTVGAEQIFTTAHFKKYLALGKKVAGHALAWSHKPLLKPGKVRAEHEKRVNENWQKTVDKYDNWKVMKKAGKTWKEMGFADAGDAEIHFRQYVSRFELPRRYLRYPKRKTGIYLCGLLHRAVPVFSWHPDQRGDYVYRIRAGRLRDVPDEKAFMRFYADFREHLIYVDAPIRSPEIYEKTLTPTIGWLRMGGHPYPYSGFKSTAHQVVADDSVPYATIWIDYQEIEGPFYPKERPTYEHILFPDGVRTDKPEIYKEENARELIEKLAYEAFRHQKPSFEYVTKLEQIFKKRLASGLKYNEAMGHVMGIILASPNFLYLQEVGLAEAGGARRELDSRELAIRLSYFLWSCPPDKELYGANLLNPVELEAQVDRMLKSPKIKKFRDGFMHQWASLERFDAITVDRKKYPTFQRATRDSMKEEVLSFFGVMLKENLPVSNLIASDFITIDPMMGHHYGVKGVTWDNKQEFKKVRVPKGSSRGGFMTQAAFLTMGANGERSSPVIRGALLMEKLMHDKPANPPPNVEELGANRTRPMTNREMVKMHRDQAACASCHDKMDVIGFGLENFDPVGKWRTTELVGEEEVPIDPSGTLRNGESFSSVQELRRLLLKQDDRLAEEMVESIMSYGLGRTVEFSDADDVQAILKKLKKQDYPLASIVKEIVLSDLFRRKR